MKIVKSILVVAFFTLFSISYAQDGKALFESKCNVCHQIDSRSTGPALKDSKARWEENSSAENFYAWIKNSKAVLDAGDPYAMGLFAEYSKSAMPPQQLSDKEIDAIFEYVQNPPAPKEETKTANAPVEPVEVVDYDTNRQYFWALIVIGIVLVLAIAGVGNALKSLLASQYYKDKLKKKEEEDAKMDTSSLKTIAILIGSSLLLPAMSFAADSKVNKDAWPMVSNGDIWALLTIDLVLLGILFYIGGLFKSVMLSIKTQKELEKIEKVKAAKPDLTKLLTDTVDVEEEASILLDHDYDGIQELDNNLPPWWKWGFYISIVFAVFYLTYFHILGGDLQLDEYNKEMHLAEIAKQEYLEKAAMNVDESNATLMVEASDLSTGKVLFDKNCAICHKMDGSGEVGPNLTDNAWIYGYDIKEVFKTVSKGTSGGMEPWSRKLNPIQVQQVSSYVLSMPLVEGKGIEGDIMEVTDLSSSDAPTDSIAVEQDTIK